MAWVKRWAVVLAVFCSGCVTWVTSEPFTGSQEGTRYSLPAVFLRVTPQADGTMKVEKLLLPDRKEQYVVRASSLISSYTFNVGVTEGLLDSVTFEPDSTGVASKVAESAGNLLKTSIEAKSAADAKQADAAQKAKQAAVDAKTDLEIADAKLKRLKGISAPADKIAEAEAAQAAAQAKFDRLRDAAVQFGFSEFNAPGEGTQAPASAWGPVLYRVMMTDKGVTLKAVEAQREFPTSMAAAPQPASAEPLRLSPKGGKVLRPKSGALSVDLESTRPLSAIVQDSVKLRAADGGEVPGLGAPQASLAADGSVVTVALDDQTPAGSYRLEIVVHTKAQAAMPVPLEVALEVRRP